MFVGTAMVGTMAADAYCCYRCDGDGPYVDGDASSDVIHAYRAHRRRDRATQEGLQVYSGSRSIAMIESAALKGRHPVAC